MGEQEDDDQVKDGRQAEGESKAADVTGNLKVPTMREIMEAHHANPTCNTCHQIFDPIGLAMENFDPTGAWRTIDEGRPIDTAGVFRRDRVSVS